MGSFHGLQILPSTVSISLVVVLLTAVIGWVYHKLIGRHLRVLRRLQAQGVPGYPFVPVYGQIFTLLEIEKRRETDPDLAAATGGTNVNGLRFQLRGPDGGTPHVWSFGLGSSICLALSDPDLVRQVCVTHNDKFRKQPFVKRALRLLGDGLLLSDGGLWERQRRLINPSLSMREVKRFIPLMSKCASEAVARWNASVSEKGAEKGASAGHASPLMMNAELAALTLDIVFRSVLGTQVEQVLEPQRVKALQSALSRHFPASMQAEQFSFLIPFFRLLPTTTSRTVEETARTINEDLRRVIAYRMEERARAKRVPKDGVNNPAAEPSDLLGLLIEAADVTPLAAHGQSTGREGGSDCIVPQEKAIERGVAVSLQQLMDECATLCAAGSESTANLLTWTMLLLSQHPEWQERAREEVVGFCMGGSFCPSFEDLNEMKVLGCILNESLRMMPSAPIITRTCVEDTCIRKDLVVPKGCDVYILIEVMHKSKDYWGPDANEFNPTRFANGTSNAGLHPGAFMPFSFGPRNCIGQNFALIEAKVILGSLLRSFTWKVAESYVHLPESLVTMQARHGLPVELYPI